MKFTKEQVIQFLKALTEAGKEVRTEKETKALATLHGEDGSSFQTTFSLSEAVVQEDSLPEETKLTEEGVAKFEKGLDGSKHKRKIEADKDNFVSKVYRMLSEQVVAGIYDFSHVPDGKKITALAQAQKDKKFDDLKFYKDHDLSVDKLVGLTTKSWFDNKSEVSGVNTSVFVYKPLDESFAIKFAKEFVDSVSVGVSFEKKRSHEFEDPWDFWYLLGHEVDGELVRFLVTEINFVQELSSVYDGADPSAKVDGGFSKSEAETFSKQEAQEMIEAGTKPLTDQITALTKERDTLADDKENLQKQVDEFGNAEEFQTLKSAYGVSLSTFAKFGYDEFERKKKELLKFLRLKGKQSFIPTIEKSEDFKMVSDFFTLYKEEIETEFALKCSACGNDTTVDRQSSQEVESEPVELTVTSVDKEQEKALDVFCEKVHGN